MGLLGLTIATAIVSKFVEQRYTLFNHRSNLVNGIDNEEFEKALVCAKRICSLRDEHRWRFQMAYALYSAGKDAHARAIIDQLAPVDHAVFKEAHMFLVDQYLNNADLDLTQEQRLDNAQVHLRHAYELDQTDSRVQLQMAAVMNIQGKTDEAMKIYRRWSDQEPAVVPDLARHMIRLGETANAEFEIERAIRNLRDLGMENPGNQRIWQTLYDVLMVQEDYPRAIQVLADAAKLTDDEGARRQISVLQSNVYVNFARSMEDVETQDSFRRQLIAINNALSKYPRNSLALESLIKLVLYPKTQEFENWLLSEARDHISPSVTHVIHGIRDCVRGNPVSGKNHFNLAFDGNNIAAIVVNDIAFILTNTKQEHQDALKLMDVAIDTWPDVWLLYQTRGEILLALDRNEEALQELKFAGESINKDFYYHELMARCLDKLNRPDEAAQHRNTSEDLKAKLIAESQRKGSEGS